MIDLGQLPALTPAQRAKLIYREARAELAQGLWRAALGEQDKRENPLVARAPDTRLGRLEAVLALVTKGGEGYRSLELPPAGRTEPALEASAASAPFVAEKGDLRAEALGANSRFAEAISRAADRAGIPASALACIVDAEAAKGHDGTWNVHSRNPRSSAAGLGQFLSGTWESEAERPGTWLNGEARRRGWLNSNGKVTAGARSSLLALRYDPEASIQATADYARGNLLRLEKAGVRVGESVESIARAAYLGHHLGPGDAAKFLSNGLDQARAKRLLEAQIGRAVALRHVAAIGNPADAHRQWLNSYIDRRIDPSRYA